jgi:hypothetical protein
LARQPLYNDCVFTPPLSIPFLILSAAFVGMAVGSLACFLASLLLRLQIGIRDIVTDGILGAIGFPLAFECALLIPWRSTITYRMGDTVVTSTMRHYQHPALVAYSAVVLLVILREFRRFRTARQSKKMRSSEQM